MKLTEVLDTPIPQMRNVNKKIRDDVYHKNMSIQGVGAQALVYLNKRFPNKIIKFVHIDGPTDPAYQFLRVCLDNQSNPYFPKIYHYKQYKPENYKNRDDHIDNIDGGSEIWGGPPDLSNFILIVVMERLYPLREITQEILQDFGMDGKEYDSSKWDERRLRRPFNHGDIFRHFFKDKQYRKKMLKRIKDKNLHSALTKLESLFIHYESDMHLNNIMTRQDGQLVFIDPITYNYDPADDL